MVPKVENVNRGRYRWSKKCQKLVNVVCEQSLRALLVLAVSPFRIDSAIQSSCIIGSKEVQIVYIYIGCFKGIPTYCMETYRVNQKQI